MDILLVQNDMIQQCDEMRIHIVKLDVGGTLLPFKPLKEYSD